MNSKELLTRAVELITFLFACFSGFLTSVAPPEDAEAKFAVGLSSFLALIVLLFISVLAKHLMQNKRRKIWLIATVFLFLLAAFSAFYYKAKLDQLTFPFPPEAAAQTGYVGGTEFTTVALQYKQTHPGKTVAEIVADFGGLSNRTLVWPVEAINQAKLLLLVSYTLLVVSLAGALFGLAEMAGQT